jgi:hypothetical protein
VIAPLQLLPAPSLLSTIVLASETVWPAPLKIPPPPLWIAAFEANVPLRIVAVEPTGLPWPVLTLLSPPP